MNTIITFHCLDGNFLQELLKNLEKKSKLNLYFSRNYCNNEEYSKKYNYVFLDNKEFENKKNNHELVSGEELYLINDIKFGLNLTDINDNLNLNKIILLNTSIKCKFSLKRELKDIDFISIMIETNDKNHTSKSTDSEKRRAIINNNKENHEYGIIIDRSDQLKEDLLKNDDLYNEISLRIRDQMQENIILKNSEKNLSNQ